MAAPVVELSFPLHGARKADRVEICAAFHRAREEWVKARKNLAFDLISATYFIHENDLRYSKRSVELSDKTGRSKDETIGCYG
jgi:hypothetical protein